jgi:hypothetical protein
VIIFFKKNWKIIAFAAVLALAVFLRVWHFQDWLFFKMDQARDALLISHALENGPGWLPLLGPKAGGTHLNLGPAFYYFQYVSAFLFQSAHPAVLAYPDLLFSILSIPLFYLFLKKYFSRDWSMVLAGLYAVCFLGIQYSRFAWNPNSLVFFNLLFFYALLNIFDENIKYKFRWIVIAGFSFAISTQLHFMSFATLPVITVIFILFNRRELGKYIDWKKIAVFMGIIFLVYLPVVVNEIITHGNNSREFISAIREKPSSHSLWQNINRNFRYWGQNWFLILTSWISKKASVASSFLAWLGVIIPGLYLGVRNYRSEKNNLKKKFLLLVILWLAAYFLIYIPIAYQIRPRFFLPLLALPFVFTGFIAQYFFEKSEKIWKTIMVAILAIIFTGNLYGTYLWFKEIKTAQKKGIYPERTIILKAQDGIVLWHLENAIEYIKNDCERAVVYVNTNAEYASPVKYLLLLNGLETNSFSDYSSGQDGCFYSFGLARTGKIDLENKNKFEVLSEKEFGALSVRKLEPKEGEIFVAKKKGEEISKRIFWKDILK